MRFRGLWREDHKSELLACLCDKGGLDCRPPKELPFLLTPSNATLITVLADLEGVRILKGENIKY